MTPALRNTNKIYSSKFHQLMSLILRNFFISNLSVTPKPWVLNKNLCQKLSNFKYNFDKKHRGSYVADKVTTALNMSVCTLHPQKGSIHLLNTPQLSWLMAYLCHILLLYSLVTLWKSYLHLLRWNSLFLSSISMIKNYWEIMQNFR